MKRIVLTAFMASIVSGSTLLAAPASAGPNCTCRHSGGEVAEGESACIKSPGGMTMARCERVLNNTSWKMLDMPCPYSKAPDLGDSNMSVAAFDAMRQFSDRSIQAE